MSNATLTYKCLNCGAGLLFDAQTQSFKCEFCLSSFTEEELVNSDSRERAEKSEREDSQFTANMKQYHCESCGAEIIADVNTAADFCYYCHNPIVISDKVTGLFKPSRIIPFKFSKDEACNTFLSFAKKKRFVPKNYFSKEQMEKISGVYYPFWLTDADTDSEMHAIGKIIRHWTQGEYKYTETTTYDVYRRGRIHFEDITTSAITGEDKSMLEGVLPYPIDEYREFSMPYLQGFVAKKRDIEREQLYGEVKGRMNDYATRLLRSTAGGYSILNVVKSDVSILRSHWEYSLMPIWILTYKKKNRRGKERTFVYAMNGCTGKVYGELPVSIPRLLLFGAGLLLSAFAALFGLGMLFIT